MVSQAIQTDVRTFVAEYRFLLADGTYGNFLDRAHIVRNEAGVGVRMIGAMIDVTAPRRAYASLEEAYRRFQAMSQELHMVESNERRRLSRELHDEVGQLLTSLKFDLASVKRSVAGRSTAAAGRGQDRLARALETTDLFCTPAPDCSGPSPSGPRRTGAQGRSGSDDRGRAGADRPALLAGV